MHGSPGCTPPPPPPGMKCPWVVSWEDGGRKRLLTVACSVCLTQILPPHAPRSPATFLVGREVGSLEVWTTSLKPLPKDRGHVGKMDGNVTDFISENRWALRTTSRGEGRGSCLRVSRGH